MASLTAKITYRLVMAILIITVLFYVGKISATTQEVHENKRTVKQGISQIVHEAQKSVDWFQDASDSGVRHDRKATSRRLLDSNLKANAIGNETDLLALLKLKESITRDPNGVLNSWNTSLHFCKWFGITCSRRHQRIMSLALGGQNLFGSISPFIGNLSFLRYIDLQNNSLHGQIPQEVGNLFRLRYINLRNNTMEGEIPINLTRCLQLEILTFSFNNFAGKIPMEIGSLSNLRILVLAANHLTGPITASIANLLMLTSFFVTQNNLVGNIPDAIGQLKSLAQLVVGINNLSGTIPPSLFNLSSIIGISITENKFHGTLPDSLGLTLPKLQIFAMGGNQFSGSIPNSIINASQLQIFDINGNNFVGNVPAYLGINLPSLRWLNLGMNNLGSNSSGDLKFLKSLKNCSYLQLLELGHNNFGGVLTNSVSNLSIHLTRLSIGANQICGSVPVELESLTQLIVLNMELNSFTGVLPSSLGKLKKIQGFFMGGNRLSGQFPSFIGNFTQIVVLYLPHNNFEGNILSNIQNCKTLNWFDVSYNILRGDLPVEVFNNLPLVIGLNLSNNFFTGKLPTEVGKLEAVNIIDISKNNLSGEIPSTIGECSNLQYLYLQGNSFQGVIPLSMFSLKNLQWLDLSNNNLTGEIPTNLQNLTFLQYLNISFNHLEGQVPIEGVFKNASLISLTGNYKLCGGVAELHLPRCSTKATMKFSKLKIIVISVILSFLLISTSFIFLFIRKFKKKQLAAAPTIDNLKKLSYTELHRATNGFSPSNLIGSGNFSSVYRGCFDQGERPVAVKVLNLQEKGASKSIVGECNALRNIRHRNLVKIITFCSSLDYKGNEFKALVMKFMENGSLEKWLSPEVHIERNLNLLQRLNIAIDVASALHYLHDLCEKPIIHCDLKPSNILLDEDMVAHVSDFGIAKFLQIANDDNKTSTIGLKGTIGYIAPEYGMGCKASKEGDVYSYGILILEMFSGRKSISEIFRDGLNLHEFVKAAFAQQKLMQIVDPALVPRELGDMQAVAHEDHGNEIEEKGEEINVDANLESRIANVLKCLVSIFEIGISCSAESPNERMKMGDVERKLHLVKNVFLRSQNQAEKHHTLQHN